jgi:hypothetical protein
MSRDRSVVRAGASGSLGSRLGTAPHAKGNGTAIPIFGPSGPEARVIFLPRNGKEGAA